jgi:hypothetical protein
VSETPASEEPEARNEPSEEPIEKPAPDPVDESRPKNKQAYKPLKTDSFLGSEGRTRHSDSDDDA